MKKARLLVICQVLWIFWEDKKWSVTNSPNKTTPSRREPKIAIITLTMTYPQTQIKKKKIKYLLQHSNLQFSLRWKKIKYLFQNSNIQFSLRQISLQSKPKPLLLPIRIMRPYNKWKNRMQSSLKQIENKQLKLFLLTALSFRLSTSIVTTPAAKLCSNSKKGISAQ